jgi:Mn2+/Fe2+ NRAMP family transporter
MAQKASKPNLLRRFFSLLGPGLITGAADDDASGIATYSIAGAQLGTAMLWTALVTSPFMACVQFMCARIGMVTGAGLGSGLRQKGPALAFIRRRAVAPVCHHL